MSSQKSHSLQQDCLIKRGDFFDCASQLFRSFFSEFQVASAHPAGVAALRGLPPSRESLQPPAMNHVSPTCAKISNDSNDKGKPFLSASSVTCPTLSQIISSITQSSLVSHPIVL